MKCLKSLVLMILLLLCCRMSAQQLCSSIVKVPFSVTDTGQPTPIKWGMDTDWDDEGNVLRGINFIGADRLTYGRVSFQVMDPVNADGTLSARQQKFLQSRLQHIALSKPTGILLNSDPVDINVDIFTHHPEQWYKVIKATVKYVQDYGLNVVSRAGLLSRRKRFPPSHTPNTRNDRSCLPSAKPLPTQEKKRLMLLTFRLRPKSI